MTVLTRDEVVNNVKAAVATVKFAAFLFYWDAKDLLRDRIHRLFVGYALASILILATEVSAESGGPRFLVWLLDLLHRLPPFLQAVGFCFFWGGFAVIAWHNWRELTLNDHERTSGDIIWTILHAKKNITEKKFLDDFLPLTLEPFRNLGAFRVALWRQDGLHAVIPEGYFHTTYEDSPPTNSLPMDSIAGIVLRKGEMRYVPRFGFPFNSGPFKHLCRPFPHSIVITIFQPENQLPVIRAEGIDRDSVHVQEDRLFIPDRALVAAPLMDMNQIVFGAITIDFVRTDPLAKAQLKTVAVMARLLGDALARIALHDHHDPLRG